MSQCEMSVPNAQKARRLLISYVIGVLATFVLVSISYFLGAHPATQGNHHTYMALGVLLVLQVIVQVVFFFRLGTRTVEDKWNFWVFMFTLLIMLIVVSGSLWIMYNLNYYMVN